MEGDDWLNEEGRGRSFFMVRTKRRENRCWNDLDKVEGAA